MHQHVRQEWRPGSFITEVAKEWVELDTIGLDITPEPEKYANIAAHLVVDINHNPARGIARIAQSFRRHYYQIVAQTLREQRFQALIITARWFGRPVLKGIWRRLNRQASVSIDLLLVEAGGAWFRTVTILASS